MTCFYIPMKQNLFKNFYARRKKFLAVAFNRHLDTRADPGILVRGGGIFSRGRWSTETHLYQHYSNEAKFIIDTKQSESGEALSPVVLAVGGVLVLSLVGTVWIVLLKLAQNKKEGEIRETVAPGNGCTFQNGEQECIYNDVRESQMMENSAISLSGKCTSLKHDPNRNIPKNHCRSLPRRQYAQWRNQLTRSKTLAPGHYGGYNRYSDDYNHLHFDKMPALPDNTTASISMDDYGIMKPKYEKTSSQNTNAEVRMSADKKKHPTMSRSETKCRPYSSVKYNRKVEME
ncbi:uncharacterized protein LOC125647227 isoform X3 [Ostrea edulis]|uniref:uncharacterized protein LOC125647227 isoform X3 n=1 Tax=Ostrea edulis TaxID=37623 RepID=UPI0024AFD3A3|nr:uncharacterized protein LOC125647227 isoform X3 [Ostrea edulis]